MVDKVSASFSCLTRSRKFRVTLNHANVGYRREGEKNIDNPQPKLISKAANQAGGVYIYVLKCAVPMQKEMINFIT